MTAPKSGREERGGWAAAQALRVNVTRDPTICYAIGRSKLLTTSDIAWLAFGSRETARDRLRKLHCAGYVRAHVRELHADNVYSLTARGRDLVVEHLGGTGDELSLVKALPQQLDHLLGINRVRIALTVASRHAPAVALRSFVPEWELRRLGSSPVVPDAMMKFADSRGDRHFIALEVDTGTENPSYVAEKKLRQGYEPLVATGMPILGARVALVVIAAPGVRRLRSLARAIDRAGVAIPVAMADLHTIAPPTALSGYARPRDLLTGSLDDLSGRFVRPLVV